MPSESGDLILYGRARVSPGETAAPAVRVKRGVTLRLSDGPYPFDEPPDIVGLAGTAERLACLRIHLQSLCGIWDKLALLFLDAYFARIEAAIAGGGAALAALAERGGGLFSPQDWSFSALRPLPQAHLPLRQGTTRLRVDFAFWTGAGFVAIELQGSASPRRQRQDELALLAADGVAIVAVPGLPLQREGEALLARLLPAPLNRFWAGVSLPSSPFGPQALDEIIAAPASP